MRSPPRWPMTMIHRRGVISVLVLLLLVLAGFVLQIVRGPVAASSSGRPAIAARPVPDTQTGQARAVVRALRSARRAYAAGDVRRLCRPGALVDPAVIRRLDARSHGCESELESLLAHEPRLRFTLRALSLRPDLATATVVTAGGDSVPVDLVRDGRHWLLSFSDGGDPLSALAGTG